MADDYDKSITPADAVPPIITVPDPLPPDEPAAIPVTGIRHGGIVPFCYYSVRHCEELATKQSIGTRYIRGCGGLRFARNDRGDWVVTISDIIAD